MRRKRAAPSASTTSASSTSTPTKTKPRRALRPRPTPRWLTGREDLDQVAQRRCLLVLSVLSGEKPVTAAIAEAGISRPLYYQYESKALLAMLRALAPGASAARALDEASAQQRVVDLEAEVAALHQDKRRLERLLYLTRKVLPAGPVAMAEKRGRKPKPRGSVKRGRGRSPSSTMTSATSATSPAASTPMPAGAPTP